MKLDFKRSTVVLFSLFFDSWCSFSFASFDDDIMVEIKQGTLRGRRFQSVVNGTTFFGFLGIPYAKPPLKHLRFQPPQPADAWQGVYNATYERDECDYYGLVRIHSVSENCLYLNIYTPQPPIRNNEPKPVMMFIHGGGFMFGSGSYRYFGPDYLIAHDVIMVTINYRLSVLGFLNLGIPECPGNVGMKDQVLALKWLKENIAKFGGDPDNITIQGESAGATAAHYLIISPLSQGLFSKAIIESGSMLSPWAINYNPTWIAFQVGKFCGYRGNDKKELVNFLKTKPRRLLMLAGYFHFLENKALYPWRIFNLSPSPEEIKEGAFLPDWPQNLAQIANPLPIIYGMNNKEGMLMFMLLQDTALPAVGQDISLIIKNNFKIDSMLLPQISAKIKQRYFGNKSIDIHMANELTDLFTDIQYYYAYDAIEFLTKSNTPPYIYEFVYYGAFNFAINGMNFLKATNIKGATHSDEIFYLFCPHILPIFERPDSKSRQMIEKMTSMWTNFAKTGVPRRDEYWKPSTTNEPYYLQIKERPQLKKGKLLGKRLEFLRELIEPAIIPGSKPYETL